MTSARNAIYKNVGVLTRNLSSGQSTEQVYYHVGDLKLSSIYSKLKSDTLIVRGNLEIDTDVTTPIGIIVLKDQTTGNGGEIRVLDKVSIIKATIFADSTFYGDGGDNQLVLNGSLFSVNTIGGSEPPMYLAGNVPTSNAELAKKQDLNTVRSGNGGKVYGTNQYSDPFIIDNSVNVGVHAGFTQ